MNAQSWIMVFAGLGTWAAALVALFGDRIRARWNRPGLVVELVHDGGERQDQIIRWEDEPGQTRQRTREARYYRLRVANRNRRGPAHEVHVVVEAITRPGPGGGDPILVLRGPIPLSWQHAEAFPAVRNVGSSIVADLLAVTSEHTLAILTVPGTREYVLGADMLITVVARSLERDSPPVQIRVVWDGGWHVGETEMRHHLRLTIID